MTQNDMANQAEKSAEIPAAGPLSSSARSRASETEIIERIHNAVLEQRLPPGTKLSEAALCDAFGASRSQIRRVLLVLSSREIVEIHSNRGAFIAKPTAGEARDVFDARRAIEPAIIKAVVERISAQGFAALEALMAAEQQAQSEQNRREAIRLSGEFHVELAKIGANRVLARYVQELVMRTSLIIGLFGHSAVQNCTKDEHRALLDAIQAGNANQAAGLMIEHFDHIEADLDLTTELPSKIDVREILG